MKIISNSTYMILVLFSGLFFQGCQDKCQIVDTYMDYDPIYMSYDDLRTSVSFEGIRNLEDPGKIYKYNNFILLNERNKGIHIIDNSNAISPNSMGFIKIPGNTDMAVKNGHLYANSYIDLVVINISNPLAPAEVGRIEAIFPQRVYGNGFVFENPEGVITEFRLVEKTETRNVDCGKNRNRQNETLFNQIDFASSGGDLTAPATGGISSAGRNDDVTGGIGGSLARFTIVGSYLYFVGNETMQLFDISIPSQPAKWADVQLGRGIETIFPYNGHLFIGSQTGMHIYDNSDPSNPIYVSTYEHVTSCDPVVVEGQYAYVTLRSGNPCQTFINQLDVVDISNLSNPSLYKSYELYNPHGLGIDNGILFICEGDAGFKVFNASDPNRIDRNILSHITDIHSYDVIPLDNILMLIGSDGFYQYDYTNPANLQYLSKIAVD